MKLNDAERIACDVLIIGGGGAGLRSAIEARHAGLDVLLVSKSRIGHATNTYIAKAVISASGWGDSRDGGDAHLKDTVRGGRFLNDRDLVSLMADAAKDEISFLEKCGVVFAKEKGNFLIEQIAGHSFPRQLRGQHRTGSDLILPLKRYAEKIGVRFLDRVFITRLFSADGRVVGASGVFHDGRFLVFGAGSVILATGGFGQMYLHTNNAAGITGDGLALALELGIPLKDMEFVQFYPTAAGRFGNRLILSEVLVMAEGAILRNRAGEDIVQKHGFQSAMELTRDRLSQIIMRELSAGEGMDGKIIMDLTPIAEERLPSLAPLLPSTLKSGRKTLLVAPTTHFCMGGIVIDNNAETSLAGLFAAGEAAAGIHGANRLGGNALCEIFAFGGIAGKSAAKRALNPVHLEPPHESIRQEKARLESLFEVNGERPKHLCRSLKEIMWLKAGILRDGGGLDEALAQIAELRSRRVTVSKGSTTDLIRCLELENMLRLAQVVCKSAKMRTESRGAHHRSDYPEEDNDRWLRNIVVRKRNGDLFLETCHVSTKQCGHRG